MKTLTLSATEARNEFFKLINAAYYGGQVTIVEKNGEEVAKIVPTEKKEFDWKRYRKLVDKMGGDMADYPKDTIRKEMRKKWKKRIDKMRND